jgi:hypothetical protein
MNIYLVCKHRKFRDSWGDGVYKECIVLKPFTNKRVASRVVKDLNGRSKKYWYSIKKLVVTI